VGSTGGEGGGEKGNVLTFSPPFLVTGRGRKREGEKRGSSIKSSVPGKHTRKGRGEKRFSCLYPHFGERGKKKGGA